MLRVSPVALASLRYRRPYWMLFLKNVDVDNWRIYTLINRPQHQLIEMNHQAWLGGLDRPYMRPKCMAHQPLWLEKKRFLLRRSRLSTSSGSGASRSPLEKYVIDWESKFHSFKGTLRPTADDLTSAFDLVEQPLDLSYACRLLRESRSTFNIRFDEDGFLVFLEACLRVDRMDVARFGLENAEDLGFWSVPPACAAFLRGEQTWYKHSAIDNKYYPLDRNDARNGGEAAAETRSSACSNNDNDNHNDGASSSSESGGADAADLAALEAELAALEAEETSIGADTANGNTNSKK